jgi:2-(1,2-epoxy-1,2-dihydrophenyl)acetyl-CoA isomerase
VIEEGVATITLDRPDVGNAIDLELARALLDAAIRCDTDDTIRCVVVTGSGRLFCAGGDVALLGSAGAGLASLLTELIGTLHLAVVRLARCAKPVLVLVNGPAAGAGLSLAILGDVVLAARSAHFSAAYSAIGLTADGGLSWLLPRLVGLRRAQEMMLTNRRVTADEAEAMGLVTRAVDDGLLGEQGRVMAARLAAAPVAALGAARGLLAESFASGLEAQLDRELRSMIRAARGEAREGLAAFLARRKPDFRGG